MSWTIDTTPVDSFVPEDLAVQLDEAVQQDQEVFMDYYTKELQLIRAEGDERLARFLGTLPGVDARFILHAFLRPFFSESDLVAGEALADYFEELDYDYLSTVLRCVAGRAAAERLSQRATDLWRSKSLATYLLDMRPGDVLAARSQCALYKTLLPEPFDSWLFKPPPVPVPNLSAGTPASLERQAIDAVNQFTRMKMREDSFYRRILPPIKITDDELDRSVPANLPSDPAWDGPYEAYRRARDLPDTLQSACLWWLRLARPTHFSSNDLACGV